MLITDIPPFVIYSYTGVATLPIPFPFYGLTTVLVAFKNPAASATDPYTPLIPNIDYRVTGTRAAENDSRQAYIRGEVTLTTAGMLKLLTGCNIIVYRNTPLEQQYSYNELDNFPAKSHENALGYAIIALQEIRATTERALQVPPGTENTEEVLNALFAIAERAETAADKAETSLTALLSIIPQPTVNDKFKILSVAVQNDKARYALTRTGGGGEGSGGIDYIVPVTDSSGLVDVRYSALGHPTDLGVLNPTINLLTSDPYYFIIKSIGEAGFTVQIFQPGGVPHVDIVEHVELGTFELGDGTELGEKGSGANVSLFITLPLP